MLTSVGGLQGVGRDALQHQQVKEGETALHALVLVLRFGFRLLCGRGSKGYSASVAKK